jgi:hypothetical protein
VCVFVCMYVCVCEYVCVCVCVYVCRERERDLPDCSNGIERRRGLVLLVAMWVVDDGGHGFGCFCLLLCVGVCVCEGGRVR